MPTCTHCHRPASLTEAETSQEAHHTARSRLCLAILQTMRGDTPMSRASTPGFRKARSFQEGRTVGITQNRPSVINKPDNSARTRTTKNLQPALPDLIPNRPQRDTMGLAEFAHVDKFRGPLLAGMSGPVTLRGPSVRRSDHSGLAGSTSSGRNQVQRLSSQSNKTVTRLAKTWSNAPGPAGVRIFRPRNRKSFACGWQKRSSESRSFLVSSVGETVMPAN